MKKRFIIIILGVVVLVGISIFAITKIHSKYELSQKNVSTQSKVETASINSNTESKATATNVNAINANKKVVEPMKQEKKGEKDNSSEQYNNTTSNNDTRVAKKSNEVIGSNSQSTVNTTAENNTNENNTSKVLNEVGYITNANFINPVCIKYNGFNVYYPGDGTKINILGEDGNYYEVSHGNTGDVNKNDITFINNQNQIHPNDNAFMSKYFGTWVVGKPIGETIGENGSYKSYSGDKLTINNKLFSFRGKNIVDPVYYVFAIQGYFGNSRYDKLNNIQFTKAGPLLLEVCEKGTVLTNKQYNDMFPSSNIIINGSSLATYGGGVGNTTINECNKI